MPDQNQPDPNQNSPQPVSKPAGSTPPIIFPQSDLPPLPSVFSTVSEPVSTGQNAPKNDIPAVPPANQSTNPPIIVDAGSGAPPDISSATPKAKKKFGAGKIIATILGLVVLVGGVGAGILLTQQPQLFQQKATTCIPGATTSCQANNGRAGTHTCNTAGTAYSDCIATITTADDPRCSGIVNSSNTLNVGSLYPTCYVNHYWCQTKKPGGCSDQLIGNAVQSASFSKNCGTEQIDLYCPLCPEYINEQTNKYNGQLFISKIYPNECSTSTSTSTPTPTPTPSPGAPSCISVKAYDDGWTALTPTQLSALTVGDVVNFCVNGTSTIGAFDKAQFMINSTLKPETTTPRPGTEDFCQSYTILSTDTTVDVKAKIHHTTLGWTGEII